MLSVVKFVSYYTDGCIILTIVGFLEKQAHIVSYQDTLSLDEIGL